MHLIDMPMEYHVWGTMLECYQKYMLKITTTAELKDCTIMWNDTPQEFINIKEIVSFRNRFR